MYSCSVVRTGTEYKMQNADVPSTLLVGTAMSMIVRVRETTKPKHSTVLLYSYIADELYRLSNAAV